MTFRSALRRAPNRWAAIGLGLLTCACGGSGPVSPERHAAVDALFATLLGNLASNPGLEKIVEIDHSRLGAAAGTAMPPARVLIVSHPALESELLRLDPRVGLDLPLRLLAHEPVPPGPSRVAFTSFAHLRSRHGLAELPELAAAHDGTLAALVEGIPSSQVTPLPEAGKEAHGIVTLDSPVDFAATKARVTAAIDAQDDAVWFGTVDFQARARRAGIEIAPAELLMFGAPGPGARAMAGAPTLGLDAFCQKLLVWEDPAGRVHVSFNDLLAVADRHGAQKSLVLRAIDKRVARTYRDALSAP